MSFRVLLHPTAAKALTKLDETNRARIMKAIGELASDPWKTGKLLHPSDFWSIRTGDYRTIYETRKGRSEVIVLFIGHRKKVYDDFTKLL